MGVDPAAWGGRHTETSGLPHHQTLLDGELVVDEDIESGRRTRRFLAYDMVMLNGKPLIQKPCKVRTSSAYEVHLHVLHVHTAQLSCMLVD